MSLISPLLAADEAEHNQDDLSRGPYEFQFRVDDPETFNKFEVGITMIRLCPLELVFIISFLFYRSKKLVNPKLCGVVTELICLMAELKWLITR